MSATQTRQERFTRRLSMIFVTIYKAIASAYSRVTSKELRGRNSMDAACGFHVDCHKRFSSNCDRWNLHLLHPIRGYWCNSTRFTLSMDKLPDLSYYFVPDRRYPVSNLWKPKGESKTVIRNGAKWSSWLRSTLYRGGQCGNADTGYPSVFLKNSTVRDHASFAEASS